jgi:hypothetical protein
MAFSLIDLLLALDPKKRPKIGEALTHPYWLEEPRACEKHEIPQVLGDWHEFESKMRRKEERRALQTKQGLENRRPSASVEASSSKSASPLKRGDESLPPDFPVITTSKEEPMDSTSTTVLPPTSLKPANSSIQSLRGTTEDSFEELLGEEKVPSRMDQFKDVKKELEQSQKPAKRPGTSSIEPESKKVKRKRGRASKSPQDRSVSRTQSRSLPPEREKERKGRERSRSPRPRNRSSSQEKSIVKSSSKPYGEENSRDSTSKSYSRKSRDKSTDRDSSFKERKEKRQSQRDDSSRRTKTEPMDLDDAKSYSRGEHSASREKVDVEIPLKLKDVDYPLAFRI